MALSCGGWKGCSLQGAISNGAMVELALVVGRTAERGVAGTTALGSWPCQGPI